MPTLNKRQTYGYNAVTGLFRMGDTDYGDTMAFCFALAECAYVLHGETFPDFRPAPSHKVGHVGSLDSESYPDGLIIDWADTGTLTLDDMRACFTVLSRYADWLRLAGRDY